MIDWEKLLTELAGRYPLVSTIVAGAFALLLMALVLWYLLFSGFNTSADFVYNQF